MAIEVKREGDVTIKIVTERFDSDRVIEVIDEFYAGTPTARVLWDFSAAEIDEVSFVEIEQIAQHSRTYAARRQKGKTAIVFSATAGFGLGNMFSTLQQVTESPIRYRSFLSRDEAIAWLERE